MRGHFLLFLLALLASFGPGQAQPTASRVEFFYGIAQGNYLIGDLKGAASGVEQILKIEPDHLPALTLKARVKLDQDEPASALEAAERALALAPDNFEYQLLKALILGNLNRQDQATALVRQVIAKAAPTSGDYRAANQLLGLIHMAEGDWDAAAQAFNRIYHADPDAAAGSLQLASEAYLEKARTAINQKKGDDAIAAINQALAIYDDKTGQESLRQRTALRMMRARMFTHLGRFDAAIEDLQTLTGQQPDNLEARVTLASLYASTERWTSLEGIIAPIAAHPELEDIALYLEGRTALAKGRVGSARAKFEAALEQLPDGPSRLRASLHFYRGNCLELLDRKAEAEAELLAALDAGFRPETTTEALLASKILLRAKQPKRAIPILEAITLNWIDPSAQAWAMLGRAHQADATPTLALSAYNQALSINPDQSETRALRGSLLRQLGDLAGAATDYENALILDPENSALTYALGLVYFQQGKLTAAEQKIGLAAQRLPENAGIQLLHALLAYAINTPKTARNALDAYLALAGEAPNETAFYLEYALNQEPAQGLKQLARRAEATTAGRSLRNFHAYCAGTLDRKAVLDAAGTADTPEVALQQICEAAYWMAQHERDRDQATAEAELLKLATTIGNTDIPEFQFAKWQLKSTKE